MTPMPKTKTWRSKKYMEWVSTLPCAITGSQGPNAPHHVRIHGNAGTGQKPSDHWCIPIRHDLHDEIHRKGSTTFEQAHNVSLVDCVLETCQKWIEKQGTR